MTTDCSFKISERPSEFAVDVLVVIILPVHMGPRWCFWIKKCRKFRDTVPLKNGSRVSLRSSNQLLGKQKKIANHVDKLPRCVSFGYVWLRVIFCLTYVVFVQISLACSEPSSKISPILIYCRNTVHFNRLWSVDS